MLPLAIKGYGAGTGTFRAWLGSIPCDEVLRYVERLLEGVVVRGIAVPANAVLYLLVSLAVRDYVFHGVLPRFE